VYVVELHPARINPNSISRFIFIPLRLYYIYALDQALVLCVTINNIYNSI
jgi:hypothetical protein